jgi:hypothetical protein
MTTLPDEAAVVVARIEAMLDEAKRLIERTGATDDSVFSLRETERRYLPDTLNAYLDVPPSQRDATAVALLVDQLQLLERATAERLAALAERGRSGLAANGAFLVERFGAADNLPEVPVATPADVTHLPPPRALVARLFSDLQAPGQLDAARVLELAGTRFAAVFPTLTTVRRGMFGGAVKSVALEVPRAADTLRYALEAERGAIAASCTKVVRGIALRSERVDFGQWLHGLFEDVSAYVERDRVARDLLTSFLAG